jgi:hypothetical protein
MRQAFCAQRFLGNTGKVKPYYHIVKITITAAESIFKAKEVVAKGVEVADAVGVGWGVSKEGIAIHLRERCQESISCDAAEAAGGGLVIANAEIAELADEVVRVQGGGVVAALTWPDACDSIGLEYGACCIEGAVEASNGIESGFSGYCHGAAKALGFGEGAEIENGCQTLGLADQGIQVWIV